MKPGDLVRILPEGIWDGYRVLWEEPITIDNDTKGLPYIRFFIDDVGTILEQKEVLDGYGSSLSLTTWVRILCSTGIGWIMRGEIKPV